MRINDLTRVKRLIGQTVSICPEIPNPPYYLRDYDFPTGEPFAATLTAIRYERGQDPLGLVVEDDHEYQVRLGSIREHAD